MINPQVGEKVFYVMVEDLRPFYLRATITKVNGPTDVDLFVQRPFEEGVIQGAEFNALKTPYTWHYPEKELLDGQEQPVTVELHTTEPIELEYQQAYQDYLDLWVDETPDPVNHLEKTLRFAERYSAYLKGCLDK